MTHDDDEASADEALASSRCIKCKAAPRHKTSKWCRQCRDEYTADYRARTRPKIVVEERTCALEGCVETFTWRSTFPRQETCSKRHYEMLQWRRSHPPLVTVELPAGLRRCPRCRVIKPEAEYTPSMLKKAWGWCRDCNNGYHKDWSQGKTDLRTRQTRKSRGNKLLIAYKAPTSDLAEILEAQDGRCLCCGGPRGAKSLHIDHDHASVLFRGLLCNGCNMGLGAFADNVGILRQAIAYLEAASWEERLEQQPRESLRPPAPTL